MYVGELCSYPIPAVKGTLRHYYWRIKKLYSNDQFEVHSGMEEQLVRPNEYGEGRVEEERIMCEYCKKKIIFDTYKHNKLFNIFFWNCDVISGRGHQTILMWLIVIFAIAALIDIENLYVVALLASILLAFNSPGVYRWNNKVPRTFCPHIKHGDLGEPFR